MRVKINLRKKRAILTTHVYSNHTPVMLLNKTCSVQVERNKLLSPAIPSSYSRILLQPTLRSQPNAQTSQLSLSVQPCLFPYLGAGVLGITASPEFSQDLSPRPAVAPHTHLKGLLPTQLSLRSA